MRRNRWKEDIAAIEASVDQLRQELARVTAQRDELRRVIGDVRRYAREEANRVTTDAVQAMIQSVRTQIKAGPPPARSEKIGGPAVHLAAHLDDPNDPRHTGID